MSNGIQNRQGSKFTVSYPDFPGFVVIPRTFKLYQEAGKQDLIEITYPYYESFYTNALKTGVTISVRWKNDSVSNEFFGCQLSSFLASEESPSNSSTSAGL